MAFSSFCQNTGKTDSLENLLRGADGLHKVDILNELAWENKYQDVEKAFGYAREALQLASEKNYSQGMAFAERNLGALWFNTRNLAESETHLLNAIAVSQKKHLDFEEAKALNILGLVYREKRDFPKALEMHNAALTRFEKLRISDEIAGTLHNIAFIYNEIGDYSKSLETYFTVLDMEKKDENLPGIARTMNNIGYAFLEVDDFTNAVKYFKDALPISLKTGNNHFIASAYHGLAYSYQGLGKTDSSIVNYQKAITFNKMSGNKNWLANNYSSLSEIFRLKGEYPTAFQYIDSVIGIHEINGNWFDLIMAYNQKGILLSETGRSKDAEILLLKSVAIADSIDPMQAVNTYHSLYQLYKKLNQPVKALSSLETFNQLSDSMKILEHEKTLIEIKNRYDLEQKTVENSYLKTENRLKERIISNQRILVGGTAFFLVLLILLAIMLYRGQRRLRALNHELLQKSDELLQKSKSLESLNASKDKFFSLIAHDLRNPFTAILGFADLLKDEISKYDDKELSSYVDIIHTSANNAFNLLENLLQWSRSQRGMLKFSPSDVTLKPFVEELLSHHAGPAEKKSIHITNQVPEGIELFADPDMLASILRNLVTNAIKFTRPNGLITVIAARHPEGILVSVADNGIGIPEEMQDRLFNLDSTYTSNGTGNEHGSGLGLVLCKEFIERHRGKIWVESTRENGSTFHLIFPEIQ